MIKAPLVTTSDDGSINIEFIKKNCRFCIFIENKIEDSFWFFIDANGNRTTETEYEQLPPKMIEYLKKFSEKKSE